MIDIMRKVLSDNKVASIYFALLLFLFSGSMLTACSDDEASGDLYLSDKWMIINKKIVEVMTNDELTITPTFSDDEAEALEYIWSSSDPDIVVVKQNYDNSATIEGIKPGKAFIKVECPGETKRLSATISVTVTQAPTRILAIGNSFSQDAVEQYLYELFKAERVESIIGNMYIGGASLELHWNNANTNAAVYEYRKIVSGKKTERTKVTLAEAIIDEKWDYISLQQASGKSGQYETYTAYLPNLISYVKERMTNKYMKLMFHQTWAYAGSSDHSEFPNYDKDQTKMYEAIVDAANKAVADNNIGILIPSGTAIQNGRTSFIGDNFCRDGYHLEITYGRYLAACTWFETISGKNVVGNSYVPEGMDSQLVKMAQNAAHAAVQSPNAVTDLIGFKKPEVESDELKAPVYIDFGAVSMSSSPWNNVTSFSAFDSPNWIKDGDGNYTNLGIRVLGGFTAAYNGTGTETKQKAIMVDGIEFPISAWKDGLMAQVARGTAGDAGPGQIEISSLDPSFKYNFTIMAVRFDGGKSARLSQYTVRGKNLSETKEIYTGMKIASSGTGVYPSFDEVPFDEYIVKFENIEPSADGKAVINVLGKDVNSHNSTDGHINALYITQVK